jgi:hypothetical protein
MMENPGPSGLSEASSTGDNALQGMENPGPSGLSGGAGRQRSKQSGYKRRTARKSTGGRLRRREEEITVEKSFASLETELKNLKNQPVCAICYVKFDYENENVRFSALHLPCCGNLLHRQCVQKYVGEDL